uniref:RING-type domain-containing protein n=1 Tax=viral metagenome TaxID=1070528 RepID=A0A6C0B0M2_9ZZZZ
MPNYKIEGEIDFYQELYNSLDNDNKCENGDICLITNQPLCNDHIVLSCNHKFNYDALYNDVINHKNKYNMMENTIVKSSEIRCPYCRKIQNELLPERDGYKNVHGVNCFDAEQELINKSYGNNTEYIHGTCNHKNIYSTDGNEIKCKNKHVKYLPIDGNYYCHLHHHSTLYAILKKKKDKEKEEKQKAKEEKLKAKEEKLKEKEEKKKAKEEKLKEKEEKKKVKEEKQKMNECNNEILQSGCLQQLQTGKNKGAVCSVKIHKGTLCLRHYRLLEKKQPTDPSFNTILQMCNQTG